MSRPTSRRRVGRAVVALVPRRLRPAVRETWARWRRRVGLVVATRGRPPRVCDDVSRWATEHQGAEARVLYGPRRIVRALPRTVEPRIDPGFVDRRTVDQPGRYLVPLHGARIVSASGLVVLPDGRFSAESVFGRSQLALEPEYRGRHHRAVRTLSGDYFSLIVRFSTWGNYYHWLHDTLTRLYRVTEHVPAGTRYLVPPDLTPFQRESLRLLGVADEQCVAFSGDEAWELETLHFAPAATNSGRGFGGFDHRDEVDRWVRDRIMDGLGITQGPARRRIYLSRRDATTRAVTNEDALEAVLHDYGFETHTTGTRSLRDQVALFAEAAVVVAPHGAGLANMLFAPPGLTVLELVGPTKVRAAHIYWAMADQLGHEYWYLVADAAPGPGPAPAEPHDEPHDEPPDEPHGDLVVPLDKLVATFARMGLAPAR